MSSFIAVLKKTFGFAPPVSRQVAKERLSIMLVHQRSVNVLSDIDMSAFQKEIQDVVRKFLKISPDRAPQISGNLTENSQSFPFLSILMPTTPTPTPTPDI